MKVPTWPGAAGILDRLEVLLYEDQFRKVAGFLVVDQQTPRGRSEKFVGTVTFISVPYFERPGALYSATYAVTTRHTLIDFENEDRFSKLRIRVNNREKKMAYIDEPAPPSKWHRHTTEDIALIPFASKRPVDIETLNLVDFQTEDQRQHFLPGSDVFMVGLFKPHPGERVIEPIFRFGHLSLIPREPVFMKIGDRNEERDAFLVEAHAWPGQSGSPVFVQDADGRGVLSTKLMGFIHGYGPEESADAASRVNSDIAIVIPAYRVFGVLEMERVVKEQKRWAEEAASKEPDPVVPVSGVPDTTTEESDKFGEFEGLTRKLLRVPKAELDKKRGEAG